MIVEVNGYRGVLLSMTQVSENMAGDGYYDVVIELQGIGKLSIDFVYETGIKFISDELNIDM